MRNKLLIFLSGFILIFTFQNCSKMIASDLQASRKAEALQANPILTEAGQEVTLIKEDVVTQPPVITSTDVQVRTVSHCSDQKTIKNNTSNVVLAKTLELQLLKKDSRKDPNKLSHKNSKLDAQKDSQIVCKETNTEKIRTNLKARKIIFSSCAIPDGEYEIKVINETGKNFAIEHKSQKFVAGKVEKNRAVEVLMDMNPNRADDLNLFQGTECDQMASPLFIDLRTNAKDLDILSAPEQGVLFDILGANAFPTAHSQIQISWFEKGKFAMLTLPNKDGQVNGIDELFGNNTTGPDGKFADNGFLALAKFDSNKDQKIDSDDAIFSSLRLWIDKNRDGKAQANELYPLSKYDFIAIDLKYDANFYEKDKYGNEIKYKSIVRKSNGDVKPVFDVWFAITK